MYGMVSRKSHKFYTVSDRVQMVALLTVLGEGGKLKTGCLSSQGKKQLLKRLFLVREFLY